MLFWQKAWALAFQGLVVFNLTEVFFVGLAKDLFQGLA